MSRPPPTWRKEHGLTLQEIAEAAEKMNFVETATVWKERRVYVNLVGANRSFAGDRNLKAYYDGRHSRLSALPVIAT